MMSPALPSLSVIIPCYNHAAFLSRAIESSLHAGSSVAELIVVDDASTDSSAEVAARWCSMDSRIQLLRSNVNVGVARSVNRGISAARGEFVLLRAADDVTLPGFVDQAVGCLRRLAALPYCLGDTRFFGDNPERGRTQPAGLRRQATSVEPRRWNELFGGNELSVFSAILRRSALEQIGGLDPDLHWVSDWAVLAELGMRHGFAYLPVPACAMRMCGGSYNSLGTRDDARQQSVFVRLLTRLGQLGDRDYEALAQSGILDFFNSVLQRNESAIRLSLPPRASKLLDVIHAPTPGSRFLCGMRAALRDFLRENQTAILQARAVTLVGAGGHTHLMLDVWAEFDFPQPVAVLVSAETTVAALRGVPVLSINDYTPTTPDLIIISSKSYEPELARLAEAHFVGKTVLRVWT